MMKSKYLTWDFFWLVLIQYVGFKISWLLAAWGAVAGPPLSYWGALPFFLFLILHVIYTRRVWELWFALSVALAGTIVDSIYNATGLIGYNGTFPGLGWLAPIWITSIWVGLAVTLDHSLNVLVGKPIWTFVTGAVFGPLAYWTGEEMGAIRFAFDACTTMAILAGPWGVMLIVCYWLLELWRPDQSSSSARNTQS
ncbi:MAG: DUF2878 domain-containing protein [Planctomycetes bacterium]|nr:DUF2878 domain-containing protein [Planctomycetota bacterium]